ncbi:hypothetical protein [Aliivibrio finisterrensis]|uniref:HEPN domain-containing protein n=1 Tax=Aliivibrio finisterrensis TaxID=511998 RepID=A0A6N6RNR7_9GAMM|nr:hypothetical protein [Aliivibrio finisterrensis]KAB2823052.1 hypothetical protein F8B77_17170 [Aliivibrio finisterrensis]
MKLFEGIKRDKTNADIGWMTSKSEAYQYGYLRAAEKLSQDFGQLDVRDKDSLIFPIVFLYRQHIELSLKSIIRILDHRFGNTRTDRILERHKILDLWDEATDLYGAYLNQKQPKLVFTNPSLVKERGIVNEFNKVDEDSFSFRYSTDKQGNELLDGISYISLNNFQEQIASVNKAIKDIFETLYHAEN